MEEYWLSSWVAPLAIKLAGANNCLIHVTRTMSLKQAEDTDAMCNP